MDLENVPVFNETVYENLVDADDPGFAVDIANQWIEQALECIPEFRRLMAGRKWAELSEKGHFLKGSAAFVGADRAKQICEELQLREKYIKPGEDIQEYYSQRVNILPDEVEAFRRALLAYTHEGS
jgi:HPt (histidine-containing phosphotransfer) domain-containing protein